jgi:YesN/AraC family two-component response regulator
MVQELHRHDFYYLLALKKGKGNHEIDFRKYGISDYNVFFMRPGQVHKLLLKSGSRGYLMEFGSSFYFSMHNLVSQFISKTSDSSRFVMPEKKFQKLYGTLTNIYQEYLGRNDNYHHIIKAYLDIFFMELIRVADDRISAPANLYLQEQFYAFLDLVTKHVSNKKRSSDYASLMNLSPWQLNAIIKSSVGKTSSAVINEYIVLEAKRYLLATSQQINQIGARLGYEDVSYFIRFFRKQTGYTPDAFRQKFA